MFDHPQTDVVHLHDESDDPVDRGGDEQRDHHERGGPHDERLVDHLLEGDHHDLRREDEVGPHGTRDDRVLGLLAPQRDRDVLGVLVVGDEPVPHLVGSLVGQVGAADHQDDLDHQRSDRAEDEGRRQDEHQLVAHRTDGDAADDRQLPFGGQAVDVGRGHRRVVDDHPGGLDRGLARRGPHVVDRRGGQLGDGGYVIQQCGEPDGHGAVPPRRRTSRQGTRGTGAVRRTADARSARRS